jgi:hypothetical protein
MRKPCPALWVICLLLASASCALARTVVVFRYDDFVGNQVNDPGFGKSEKRFEADKTAFAAFTQRAIPFTVAVIPYAKFDGQAPEGPLTGDAGRMALIRGAIKSGLCEPALHSLAVDDHDVHYLRLTYDEELAKVQRGKSDLEAWFGRPVQVLIPPEHIYDEPALRAIRDAGFTIFSGGPGPAYIKDMAYLPACWPGPIPVEVVRKIASYPEDSLIVVMLHPFDFKVNDLFGTAQFDAQTFGRYLADIIATPGVEVLSMPEVVTRYPQLVSAQREAAKHAAVQMIRSRKLYTPLTRAAFGDRPAEAAWTTAVWEPLANKFYLPHVALGLLSLGLMTLLWKVLSRNRIGIVFLVTGPVLLLVELLATLSSGYNNLGLNHQALVVAEAVAVLYSAARFVDVYRVITSGSFRAKRIAQRRRGG